MIREFWTENFLSIKDRQSMNFEVGDNNDSWMSTTISDGDRDYTYSQLGSMFKELGIV